MRPRFHRRALSVLAPLALALSLSACGSSGSDSQPEKGLESVTIAGKVGEAPQVTWHGRLNVTKTTTKDLVTGSGPAVPSGDPVLVQLWLGNGYDQTVALDTYKDKTPLLSTQLTPFFAQEIAGKTVGSRIAFSANAKDVFGDSGNPDLNIGNRDPLIGVIDLVAKPLDGPSGRAVRPDAWVPQIQTKGDQVVSLDFKNTPAPSKHLLSQTLIQGRGATVQKGQTIVANYLGQVFDGAKPFDESYSKGQPLATSIGTGSVIKGWDRALVGQKVGSRVVISVPPQLGYGAKGSSDGSIKGTDTLYFVIDILAAS